MVSLLSKSYILIYSYHSSHVTNISDKSNDVVYYIRQLGRLIFLSRDTNFDCFDSGRPTTTSQRCTPLHCVMTHVIICLYNSFLPLAALIWESDQIEAEISSFKNKKIKANLSLIVVITNKLRSYNKLYFKQSSFFEAILKKLTHVTRNYYTDT